MLYKCTLPFPPSVNTAYANSVKGRYKGRVRSKAYIKWKKSCPPLKRLEIETPVRVVYNLYTPDHNRRRDISNYIKVPEDFLVYCGVIKDDDMKIVKRIEINAAGVDKGYPRVEIEIYPIED